jgi:hypothetical protein
LKASEVFSISHTAVAFGIKTFEVIAGLQIRKRARRRRQARGQMEQRADDHGRGKSVGGDIAPGKREGKAKEAGRLHEKRCAVGAELGMVSGEGSASKGGAYARPFVCRD